MSAARIAVAFDTTHSHLSATGLGRYPTELLPALRAHDALRMVPISAVAEAPRRAVTRVTQGLRREGLYYPGGLARRARGASADLLHCPTPAPVRGGGLPVVVTVHDLLPLRSPEWFTRETRAHTRLTLPFLRRADHLLTNSAWTRDEVLDLLGVAPERVTVTPFGVAPRFEPREVDRERLAARYGIEGRYVLCVGTREPRKNLGFAARAFGLVAADVPDCELVVTGARGWGLDESAHEGARIRRTGFVGDDDLVELYAGAACFFFPSLAEGFGFPPLEAMACGAPVVSSERRAMADVLGDAALLVDPTDAEAAAEALRRVLGDEQLASRLRDAGVRRASEFTWERCAQATADAYAAAVASTRS